MNPEHVADIRYAELEDIRNEVKPRPEDYTPWFRIALATYLEPLGS